MKVETIAIKTGKIAAKTGFRAGVLLFRSLSLLRRGLVKGVQEAYEEIKEAKKTPEKET